MRLIINTLKLLTLVAVFTATIACGVYGAYILTTLLL